MLDLLLVSLITGIVFASAMQAYKKLLSLDQSLNKRNVNFFVLNRAKDIIFNDLSSMFVPTNPANNPGKNAEATKACCFELSSQEERFKSKIFKDAPSLHNLAHMSFASTNNLNALTSARSIRVTYALYPSSTNNAVQDSYELVRLQTNDLWHTPEKKRLNTKVKTVILDNVTEFCCSCLKTPPANEKPTAKKEDIVEVSSWGSLAEEEKTLPTAVLIKAVCLQDEKPQKIDLIIPVITAGAITLDTKTTPTEKSTSEDGLSTGDPFIDDFMKKLPDHVIDSVKKFADKFMDKLKFDDQESKSTEKESTDNSGSTLPNSVESPPDSPDNQDV